MATVLEAFKSLREETQKVYAEVITKIGDLQEAVDNLTNQLGSRELTAEEEQALAGVRDQLNLLDDIVPDPVDVPEAPGAVPGADNHVEPGQVVTAVPGDVPNPNTPPVNVDLDPTPTPEEPAPEPAVTTEAPAEPAPEASAEPASDGETPAEPVADDNGVTNEG